VELRREATELTGDIGLNIEQTARIAEAAADLRHHTFFHQDTWRDPEAAQMHANLGTALLAQDDVSGATASYETALRFGPLSHQCLERLAVAYAAAGRLGDRGHIPAETPVSSLALPSSRLPEAWATIARMLHERSEHATAISLCRSALQHVPADPGIRVVLAGILVDVGSPHEAATICRHVVAATRDANAWYVLGRALSDIEDNPAAVEAFRHCLELNSGHVAALYYLAAALSKIGLNHFAIPLLEMAAEMRPDDARNHFALGNALQLHGETARAHVHFRRASELQPIVTWHAAGAAEFAALLIQAPGTANTPHEFLFRDSPYDRHFVAVLPEMMPDIALLKRHGDVVINLISDPDQGADMLAAAAGVIESLGKPVINHPRNVLATARDLVAGCLVGIALCRVPATRRLTQALLARPDALDFLERDGFALPLLLRVAGTHGGEAFEKMESGQDVADFIAAHPAKEFYVSEYVDYCSNDGFFRKYRFVFSEAEILPYHLAIGQHWKIHHCTTEMAHHSWMQEEEKAFLQNRHGVFSPAHYDALAAIRAAIGLDFFGIDCALDRDGNIVVFEVNTSILIHDDNKDFPYKTPYCFAIRQSLDAMLRRAAKAKAKI
jgi:tetratricopeptide (TPR) repeat protein